MRLFRLKHVPYGLAGALLCVAAVALAAPPRPVIVSESDLTSITVITGTKENILFCLDSEPGKIKDLDQQVRFTPLRYELAQAKKKLKLKPLSAALKRKVKVLKQLLALALPACGSAGEDATPTPTETEEPAATPTSSIPGQASPTPTRTVAPTSTPNPRAMFDSQGNVTALGKTYLKIPDNLTANIDAGDSAHDLFSCAGCHGEKTNRDYDFLLSRLPQSPMFITVPGQVSYQQLADMVAYLNRFRTTVP